MTIQGGCLCGKVRYPDLHIFVGSKAEWYDIADDLPQFEKRPPDTWKAQKQNVWSK